MGSPEAQMQLKVIPPTCPQYPTKRCVSSWPPGLVAIWCQVDQLEGKDWEKSSEQSPLWAGKHSWTLYTTLWRALAEPSLLLAPRAHMSRKLKSEVLVGPKPGHSAVGYSIFTAEPVLSLQPLFIGNKYWCTGLLSGQLCLLLVSESRTTCNWDNSAI